MVELNLLNVACHVKEVLMKDPLKRREEMFRLQEIFHLEGLVQRHGMLEVRHRPVFTGIAPRSAQDESEALLSQFFHEFLQSGVVTGMLDKLKKSGAFDRDGETKCLC